MEASAIITTIDTLCQPKRCAASHILTFLPNRLNKRQLSDHRPCPTDPRLFSFFLHLFQFLFHFSVAQLETPYHVGSVGVFGFFTHVSLGREIRHVSILNNAYFKMLKESKRYHGKNLKKPNKSGDVKIPTAYFTCVQTLVTTKKSLHEKD